MKYLLTSALVLSIAAAPAAPQSATAGKLPKRSARTPSAVPQPPGTLPPFSFGPAVGYELAGSEPGDMLVRDLDGDGHLDLCVAARADPDVGVLWGDGTGDFSEGDDFQAVFGAYDPGPWGLASADFNGDALPDLAVTLGGQYTGTGASNHKVNVLWNDGDRNFVYGLTLQASGSFPIDASAADFNGDQLPDLAVVSNTAGIDVFPGLGSGAFGARQAILGNPPQNLLGCEAVDFNADGHMDLIATNAGLFAGHTVYWGDGTGWFDSTRSAWLAPGYGLDVADLNGDGFLDVVSSAPTKFPNYTGGLWVMLGTGSGTVTHAGTYGTPFTGAVSIGNLNGDGKPDVVGLEGAGIRTYYGLGDGGFQQGPQLGAGVQPADLTLGDWNADGLDDVASPDRNWGDTAYMTVLMNTTPQAP